MLMSKFQMKKKTNNKTKQNPTNKIVAHDNYSSLKKQQLISSIGNLS